MRETDIEHVQKILSMGNSSYPITKEEYTFKCTNLMRIIL